MAKGIDPNIDLHFQDQVEHLGPEQEVVINLQEGASDSALQGIAGLKVAEVRDGSIKATASRAAASELLARPDVQRVMPVARPKMLSVLLRLRNPAWDKSIPGFERGSQIGNILTGQATRDAIQILANDADVISVEASREGGTPSCFQSIPFVMGVPPAGPPLSEKGGGVLVALIDSGVDVLHDAFKDSQGRTRLVGIWDQTSAAGDTPAAAAAKGNTAGAAYNARYGRFHSEQDINGYLTANAVPGDLKRDPDQHGTHVASIMAGSPFTPPAPQPAFPGGLAPEARILLVKAKTTTAPGDPASIGYSRSHVDALAFIKETARALGMPVAVNVSLGMNAGAHDGTSLLEVAFDEFSSGGREPGLIVVKSAGNEHSHGGHAETVVPHGGTATIGWTTKTAFRTQDYLEFWSASGDELEFTVTGPGVSASVTRKSPRAQANLPGTAGTLYLAYERFYQDNGDARLIVIVRNNAGTSISVAGNWALAIRGAKVISGGVVHGWVERINLSPRPLAFTTGMVAARTLSIPGTARTVVCVGACDLSTPVAVQSFSSQGPCRDDRRKPDLVAPGHNIIAAGAGTQNGTVAMPGTSMAAPHVTGAVALVLAHRKRQGLDQVNAAQVRAGLTQSTKGFSGVWRQAEGFGCLDVQTFFDLFA